MAQRLGKHLHEVMGWPGPMTERQFRVWLLALNPQAWVEQDQLPQGPERQAREREAKVREAERLKAKGWVQGPDRKRSEIVF